MEQKYIMPLRTKFIIRGIQVRRGRIRLSVLNLVFRFGAWTSAMMAQKY